MPLGAHLPVSKGFESALQQARALDCDCLQIFSKSPRQWNAAPLDVKMAERFRAAWQSSGLRPLAAHDSYLINMAAPTDEMRQKSVAAMIDEVERADLLGCDFLVTHCGAHLQKDCALGGEGVKAGLDHLAESLKIVLDKTPDARVRIALENTAGQGTCLGGPFEHLAHVLNKVGSDRLVVCLDTCHAFAAGHDIATSDGLDAALHTFDSTIGLHRLAMVHLNDSKGERGKNLDRHEHIGQGQIGRDGMQGILRHPHLKDLPFMLETPDIDTMIASDLQTVRELRGE